MNSPAHDIALYLDSLGEGDFGGSVEWAISANSEPASPHSSITIYDTGGLPPDTDELDLFRPSFQVRVRGQSFPAVYAKQEAIRDLLIMSSHEMETSFFVGIVMSSEILTIGRDDAGNHITTANYTSIRKAL